MAYCLLGIVGGLLQARLLAGFTRAVTAGRRDARAMVRGVLQSFLPLVLLLPVALWRPAALPWAGGGMAAALLIGTGICLVGKKEARPGA